MANVIWKCPSCGSGRRAPTRLRKIDVRRYCLECSKVEGVLVECVAPALERKRVASAERSAAKQKRRAERERAKRLVAGVHVDQEAARLIRKLGWDIAQPTIRIRRCRSYPRARLGSARYWDNEIMLADYPGITAGDVKHTLLHELVHLKLPFCGHNRKFKRVFADALWDAYGVKRTTSAPAYHSHAEANAIDRPKE